MRAVMSRLVREAADQKHLTTLVIFLAAVARELVQQTWGQKWFDPLSEALVGTLIAPAVVSLLVYAVLATFERQQALLEEQKEKLVEAERSKLALDTILHMSATVQHEINNPLMAIKGNVEISLMEDESNPRLHKIKDAVERIREVTTLLAQIKTVKLIVDGNRPMVDLEASVKEKLTSGYLDTPQTDTEIEGLLKRFDSGTKTDNEGPL
jgi:signal transduction histidine kinase